MVAQPPPLIQAKTVSIDTCYQNIQKYHKVILNKNFLIITEENR